MLSFGMSMHSYRSAYSFNQTLCPSSLSLRHVSKLSFHGMVLALCSISTVRNTSRLKVEVGQHTYSSEYSESSELDSSSDDDDCS